MKKGAPVGAPFDQIYVWSQVVTVFFIVTATSEIYKPSTGSAMITIVQMILASVDARDVKTW